MEIPKQLHFLSKRINNQFISHYHQTILFFYFCVCTVILKLIYFKILDKMNENTEIQFKIDEDDENELEYMPLCAEKLIICFLKKLSNSVEHPNLKEDWLSIDKRLELEGLDTYEVSLITREIKSSLNQNNFINALKKLSELHSILRDLNIPKLFRLINANNDALDLV